MNHISATLSDSSVPTTAYVMTSKSTNTTPQQNTVRDIQIAMSKISRLKTDLDAFEIGSPQHVSINTELEKWIGECSRLQAVVSRSARAITKEARYVTSQANGRVDPHKQLEKEYEILKKRYDALLEQHTGVEKKLAEVETKWLEADSQLHKERRERSELLACLEGKRAEDEAERRVRSDLCVALEAKCAQVDRKCTETDELLQRERQEKLALKEGSDLSSQLETASYGLSVLRAVAEITKLPSLLMEGLQLTFKGVSEAKKHFETHDQALTLTELARLQPEVEKWTSEFLRLHEEVLANVRLAFDEGLTKPTYVVEQDSPERANEKTKQEKVEEARCVVQQDSSTLVEGLSTTVQIGKCKVSLTAENGIRLAAVLEVSMFKDWLDNIGKEKRIEVSRVHVQSVDMFGQRLGFVKFSADVGVDGKDIPGIVFMRGGAVAILVVLHHHDCRYTLIVRQARVPVCLGGVAEIPAGMLDGDGNFAGVAAKEMKEETGICINESDLTDMTSLYHKNGYPGVFSSCGATDEFYRLFLYQKTVSTEELATLNGKLTGVAEEGEMIRLQIVPLEKLWRMSPDAKALSALTLYNKLKGEGHIPAWEARDDAFHDIIE